MGLDRLERGPVRAQAAAVADLRRVVELACLAPSVRNAQPWRWHAPGPGVLELHADPARIVGDWDDDARMLLLSCGAVLDHAVLVARALGCEVDVERMPGRLASRPDRPAPLARLRLRTGRPSPSAATDLEAVLGRRTDRRRFTTWPVPVGHLHDLAVVASRRGAVAAPVVDLADRVRIERLLGRATDRQARAVARLGAAPAPVPFAGPVPIEPERELEPADGLLVLGSPAGRDRALDRLVVGEALSALWLHATTVGLSIVPLSVICEVPETRLALAQDVLGGLLEPQVLVRVGWQPIGQAARSPRRALSDVLTIA